MAWLPSDLLNNSVQKMIQCAEKLDQSFDNFDLSKYLKWQMEPMIRMKKFQEAIHHRSYNERELQQFGFKGITAYNMNQSMNEDAFLTSELTNIQTNEFNGDVKWCYNCFASDIECKLLNCSKCKSAKYCSIKCQSENWDYHKKTCSKEAITRITNSDINCDLLSQVLWMLCNQFHYFRPKPNTDEPMSDIDPNKMITHCKQRIDYSHDTMWMIKFIDKAYQLHSTGDLQVTADCMESLPCPQFFDEIGQTMHHLFRRFGVQSKEEYLSIYRTFWSIPGMVEYLLHRPFINKHLIELRKKGFGTYRNLPNKKQFEHWSHLTAFGSDSINEWCWWIITFFSRTVTHDAFIPLNRTPFSCISEGKSQFMDPSIMPMVNVVKRKMIRLFVSMDALCSCDEGLMSTTINIVAHYLKDCHKKIRWELIKQGLFLSIVFVSNRCSNTVGTCNILKCIDVKQDVPYIHCEYEKMVLFISIFKNYSAVKEQMSPDGFLNKDESQNKWKQLMVLNDICREIIDDSADKFIKLLNDIKHSEIYHYSVGMPDFMSITYDDKLFFYWLLMYIVRKRGNKSQINVKQNIYFTLKNKTFMKYLNDKNCIYKKWINKRQKKKAKKLKGKHKYCSSLFCMKRSRYKCRQCKLEGYCSSQCQKIGWVMGHRQTCLEMQF
eukprot:297052_1